MFENAAWTVDPPSTQQCYNCIRYMTRGVVPAYWSGVSAQKPSPQADQPFLAQQQAAKRLSPQYPAWSSSCQQNTACSSYADLSGREGGAVAWNLPRWPNPQQPPRTSSTRLPLATPTNARISACQGAADLQACLGIALAFRTRVWLPVPGSALALPRCGLAASNPASLQARKRVRAATRHAANSACSCRKGLLSSRSSSLCCADCSSCLSAGQKRPWWCSMRWSSTKALRYRHCRASRHVASACGGRRVGRGWEERWARERAAPVSADSR